MTREEAKEKLKDILAEATENEDAVCYVTSDDADVLKAAIQVLEQEPCEDCVSRDEVHEMLENVPFKDTDKWYNWQQKACLRLAEIPSVTPQPKTARWMHPYKSDIACECSECHVQMPITNYFNYCPNCGAKMKDGD